MTTTMLPDTAGALQGHRTGQPVNAGTTGSGGGGSDCARWESTETGQQCCGGAGDKGPRRSDRTEPTEQHLFGMAHDGSGSDARNDVKTLRELAPRRRDRLMAGPSLVVGDTGLEPATPAV